MPSSDEVQSLPPLNSLLMAETLTYTAVHPCTAVHSQLCQSSHLTNGLSPVIACRPEPQPRKRPKYTRSKTGCMTCRVKKIKCDEVKPNCTRCTVSQRDCTWPEGIPARKKSASRTDVIDRPSTECSSGVYESPTSPGRKSIPSKRFTNEHLILTSRRYSHEHYAPYHVPVSDSSGRFCNDRPLSYPLPTSSQGILNVLPDPLPYASNARYDTGCSQVYGSRHVGFRPLTHESATWSASLGYDRFL